MLKLKLKRFACSVVSVAMLTSPIAISPAVAGTGLNDPQVIAIKQQLLAAMAAGATAQVSAQQQQDTAAKQSNDCNDISQRALASAQAVIGRGTPPDPTKIIQQTTCFIDVAMVEIPVVLTGIGFIDGLIRQYLQKFLTGQCTKATNFLGDLQNQALAQLSQSTGAAGLAMGYATTGNINLGALQNAATTLTQGYLANAGANTVSNQFGGGMANGISDVGTAMNSIQRTATSAFCSIGIADAALCPNCTDNPVHANCMGPKPSCGYFPGVQPPLCIDYTNYGVGS